MTLGNVHGANPIHGLLSSSPDWRVTEVKADAHGAHVTSKLEFWKHPDLMRQWPFAHEYEMTYSLCGRRLAGGHRGNQSRRGTDASGDRLSSVLPDSRMCRATIGWGASPPASA